MILFMGGVYFAHIVYHIAQIELFVFVQKAESFNL